MSNLLTQADRTVILDTGEEAKASFPIIVSASRSTDIPAFYSDWFFERLKKGYSAWTNIFNHKKYYIGYKDTKFIVFWSKNPKPLLKHLDYLSANDIGCYIQFTLNDYEKDGLEPGVPPLAERIATFRELVRRLGEGAVVWRFDPLLLTESIGIEQLCDKIRNIGCHLHEYTEKLVFSFADISRYKKVRANLEKNHIPWRDWSFEEMQEFAARLVELNEKEGWNLALATCGEIADFPGIEHNKCIDDRLILRLRPYSHELLKFLGAEIRSGNNLFGTIPASGIDRGDGSYLEILKNNRDKGQRPTCGCSKSKDIGQYDTCIHGCAYCYANHSKESAWRNHARHLAKPYGESIAGG